MTTSVLTQPVFGDLTSLEAVKAQLQTCGGLLKGKYSSTISGVRCYCIVGAIRQVVYGVDSYETNCEGRVRRLSNLIAETIPAFDLAGEVKLQLRVDEQFKEQADKVEGMNRIFVYNDYVLYTLSSTDSTRPDHWDPDVNARNKAIKLLEATIERVKELT